MTGASFSEFVSDLFAPDIYHISIVSLLKILAYTLEDRSLKPKSSSQCPTPLRFRLLTERMVVGKPWPKGGG